MSNRILKRPKKSKRRQLFLTQKTDNFALFHFSIAMEKRIQRMVNKINLTGHGQCDHPQLFCGQGQHHRRVDSSKCYDWRGRLRGKCLVYLFKFVLQLSACIPGHSGGGEDGEVDLLGEHQIELCQTLMYQYTRKYL